MKIFAGHDGGSGCSWYRIRLPLDALARYAGHEITYADAGDANGHPPSVTLPMLRGYDVVVAQRWNKHTGLGIWRQAALWAKTVYEIDDDVFSITPENWGAFHLYSRGDVRDAVGHAAETADLVTVSTEPLAAVMREYSGNVAVLPNCLPDWVLALPRATGTRPRVGWQGGSSHGIDIGQVASPVRRFLKRFPAWGLQLNGTDYRDTFRLRPGQARFVPWVPVYREPERYYASIDFDIGLCPLWPTTFSASKSAIKAIEYAARGIPVIASACPAYEHVITHGVDGFLVKQDHEWLSYLSELAADDGLRAKMGEAARATAARHVISAHWREWDDAYTALFARARLGVIVRPVSRAARHRLGV